MFCDNNKQMERGIEMPRKTLKKFKKTKEEKKMLRNKNRNNISSISCDNSCAFDISRSKHKLNIR